MKWLALSGLLMLSSCFWGPDTYEKEVNDFFFLYSEDYSTWDARLGTIDKNGVRIQDAYLSFIKRIGWDDSFLICETKLSGYYIQDLRRLKGKDPSQFRSNLFGPYPDESTFNQGCDNLGVNEDLEFEISYPATRVTRTQSP